MLLNVTVSEAFKLREISRFVISEGRESWPVLEELGKSHWKNGFGGSGFVPGIENEIAWMVQDAFLINREERIYWKFSSVDGVDFPAVFFRR